MSSLLAALIATGAVVPTGAPCVDSSSVRTESTVLNYLNELDSNPQFVELHQQHSSNLMLAYGLNNEEIVAVQSGDKVQIAKAIGVQNSEFLIMVAVYKITDPYQN